MATKTPTVELISTRSHSVTIDGPNYRPGQTTPDKEEVWFTFAGEWRGQRATVELCADRYTHSSGLSGWRIWTHEAREATVGERHYGPALSDTARQRLGQAACPLVAEWLGSDEYRVSEQAAYAHAIKRALRDARPTDYGVRDAVNALAQWRHKLSDAQAERLGYAVGAFDTYVTAFSLLDDD